MHGIGIRHVAVLLGTCLAIALPDSRTAARSLELDQPQAGQSEPWRPAQPAPTRSVDPRLSLDRQTAARLAEAEPSASRLAPPEAPLFDGPTLVPSTAQSPPPAIELSPLGPPACSPLREARDHDAFAPWGWQFFPKGLLYPAYLAGMRETRFGIQIFNERDQGWYFDATLGARIGFLRYGNDSPVWPEGWQLDVEASAIPRMTLDEFRDMIATDFRYGFPITYRRGRVEWKFGFYHLSSHLGDEYIISGRPLHSQNKRFDRINYLRDVLVAGVGVRPTDSTRLYAEAGWAFNNDDGSEPWELQFGAEYSPYLPQGPPGSPFLAVNAHLREEVDFGGGLSAQLGWQRRLAYGRLFRTGFHYFNGPSEQYQFFREHEEHFGFGIWYDF